MQLLKNMKVLSDDEIYQIHMTVMEVLWQIGIQVEEKESLALLEKNGAKVDYNTHRAYLPADLIQRSLESKTHSFSFYDVYGNKTMDLGGNRTYNSTCGYSTFYYDNDLQTKEGTYDALAKEVLYADAMDEIHMIQPSIQPCDIAADVQDLYMAKALLVGSKKPIRSVGNTEKTTEGIIMMNAEMVGGVENLYKKPRFLFNVCTYSPLTIRKDACEVIRQSAKYNIPCEFSTGPMAGATSPITLASTIVESFAEVIGHIVLTQCYKPGLPVTLLHAARIFDMKFCACTVATPEYAVMKVAASQMAHFYRIPIGVLSSVADSNEFDVQMGWEKFMTAFVSRQAGVNINFGAGLYSQLNQFSYISLAIDAEMFRNIERIGRGMEVNDYSLAFEAIKEGVESGGDFMSSDLTLFHYQEEFLIPELSDRTPVQNHLRKEGKDTLVNRALEKLDEYENAYDYTLGREKEDDLQKIIEEYGE